MTESPTPANTHSIHRFFRLLGYITLAVILIVGGATMLEEGSTGGSTHPTCETTMPAINGKLRHGQPLTEREETWRKECGRE